MRQHLLESVLNPTSTSRSPSPTSVPLPHVEEQRILRNETIAAFHNSAPVNSKADNGSEEEDDGLFVPRSKTLDELAVEEEEYRAFLEREVGGDLKELVVVEEGGLRVREESLGDARSQKDTEMKKKKKKSSNKTDGADAAVNNEKDQEFLVK